MLGAKPSLLIGSQLRALLLHQCVGSAFRGRLRVGNAVRRSKRCSARGRAAAVRDTVRLVNYERFRRRGREKLPSRRGRDGWEEPLDDNAKSFRIRDAAFVRVDRASPAQAQSAAPVRAPPRPPRLVASVHLQLCSVMSGLVRGVRPPPLSSSAGGRATTQRARSLICVPIARSTTHCVTTLSTSIPHAIMSRSMLVYPRVRCASQCAR